MTTREQWNGLLTGRADGGDCPSLRFPLKKSTRGSSGSFIGRCSDDRRWSIKPLNNGQSPRTLVAELVVGSAALLIDAPSCEVSPIRIPPELRGWEFRAGATLEPGIACGSGEVVGALEVNHLTNEDQDDNARRHVGVYAIYDWCWGADNQWLYAGPEKSVYSHDHGQYLPNGAGWDEPALLANLATPHPLPDQGVRIEGPAVEGVATRLEAITQADLVSVLVEVPTSWPVTEHELEALGFFLESRTRDVAERMRVSLGGTP